MSNIMIFLNVAVSQPSAVHQIASLSGLPDEADVRDGQTLWVKTYIAEVPILDGFPIDEWFHAMPGNAAELSIDKEAIRDFCAAVEKTADRGWYDEDFKPLRKQLKQIAKKMRDTNAYFNLLLDY